MKEPRPMRVKMSTEESNASRRVVRGRNQDVADWQSIDANILSRAIAVVARCGGALRFGYTRDGGAYSIGFYGDGEPYTDYLRPSDDIEAYLTEVTTRWDT